MTSNAPFMSLAMKLRDDTKQLAIWLPGAGSTFAVSCDSDPTNVRSQFVYVCVYVSRFHVAGMPLLPLEVMSEVHPMVLAKNAFQFSEASELATQMRLEKSVTHVLQEMHIAASETKNIN